ncbi:GNAT family N-acetyltransferase [Floricoccus penangensis]|uniref:GNAT family N-acetyltransferase n=1 Tax=Floricoccus penangensis TaxID=1859475 RepID=UPI0009F6A0C2|nr:hypothetical protein [Floricoccus penangensis]
MTEVIYTERLIIRPMLLSYYDNWIGSQNNRFPSQYKHDDGFKDISTHNFEWFKEYIEECSFLASEDKIRVFGIFDKESSTYLGLIDVITLSRANVDWAEIG